MSSPPAGDIVLSFLSPAQEEEFERQHSGELVRAREASRGVRAAARELYLNLVATIGTVRGSSGLTLRQRLTPSGQASLWWYHPVSFKKCEGDPTFQSIIAVMTIRGVAEQCGVSKLILVGAPREVAAVLRSRFSVKEIGTHQSHGLWWLVLRGLVGRVLYAAQTLRICAGCRRWTSRPRYLSQIAFSGFWDWSVSWNDQPGSLSDRYFKSLPDELRGGLVATPR